MIDRILDQITRTVSQTVPPGLTREVKKNLRAALRGTFERLNLVTREELDVQEAVLVRARERLVELEKRVAELEQKIKN
jgi:hypothetical protein